LFKAILVITVLLAVDVASAKKWRNRESALFQGLKYHIPDYQSYSPAAPAPAQWFQQTVDHYDPLNNATFQQLYYVNETYWRPDGPVFILLGGEGPLKPDAVSDHFVIATYAAKFGALIVAVEHRFYGQSMPAPNLSTQNLRLLSSQQALADYALFQQFIVGSYNLTEENKWISFGGSYSGSLSAWYRSKYPTLIEGSIATSAPVRAKLDFPEYFEVVQRSIGPVCAARVQNVTDLVTGMLTSDDGRKQLQTIFTTCDPIVSTDDVATFMSSLTDGICEIVQYNRDNNNYLPFDIPTMCGILLKGTTNEEMLASFANFTMIFNQFSGENCTWTNYDGMIEEMQDTDPTSPSAAGRSWTWQTCTEFGYFQTGEGDNQPFSDTISLEWYLRQCNDIFGLPLVPKIEAINAIYGSIDLKSSKIVFPNGSIDPWHMLGILVQECKSEPSKLMNGTAHCADLYPPAASDVPDLTAIRSEEVTLIAEWLERKCA